MSSKARAARKVGESYLEWRKGDTFVVPLWQWHAHENLGNDEAILFSLSDRPVMEALQLYREEAASSKGFSPFFPRFTEFPMASTVKLRLASRAYDGTLPILRGQMTIPGFDFDITETEDVPGMFAGMYKGQYDVSEMSLGELISYTSRSKADFAAIPVFPSRMFRHGFIFCRKDSGINRPTDLSGRKIGFLRWVQTAAIWMRGMLVDEYGVSAARFRMVCCLDASLGRSRPGCDGGAARRFDDPHDRKPRQKYF